MQIIYSDDELSSKYINKINIFQKNIVDHPFILLVRPTKDVFETNINQNYFIKSIEEIIESGLKIIEFAWEDNDNWLNLMQKLRLKFPNIQMGSSTIKNKKSIDDSIYVGFNFSMMRFWDKDLFNYSKEKNFLLIPGIRQLNYINEAISNNCKIIKIYPVKEKEKILNIRNFEKITFVGAGDLSIKDIEQYKSFGYSAIIIGQKGFNGGNFDPNIFKYLKTKLN